MNTKLAFKGGSGRALVPFLKKIGFVNSDGAPSDIYIRFRNPSEAGSAVADAIKIGFRPLYDSNEYAHDLEDDELKGLIVQVTGQSADSNVVSLIQRTYKNLKELADFEATPSAEPSSTTPMPPVEIRPAGQQPPPKQVQAGRVGMNLSYTINLNLPATSDISVFNAIFKSLKENLLDSDELE